MLDLALPHYPLDGATRNNCPLLLQRCRKASMDAQG
jgi:hypothetical protein